ncbi:hypothetical protein HNV11_17990 [Spirosoma taeanense]|uniref:SGNH hydrolase-type esterase domain-containing protein n=1 Tax=Spirosoma taeanense TaxID=2735870 RepID=A0A6M5YCZ7_9BACT|nr:GDSL-type esterase/lipase family protein [Spirosoma taeanense]QJW91131.1 hypothetical protein HNV11_17990 [Spirosoma taeanense]
MKFAGCVILLLSSLTAFSQAQSQSVKPPFESEILAFEQADRTSPPPQHPIVFTGSSSIRFWTDLSRYFPDKTILNRGFGGSQLSDVLRYVDRVILPYQPKQIVLYAGENDIASGKQSAQQTYERFVSLFNYVRKKLPNVPFTFIAIKPSPSRRQYFGEVDEANRLISRFLARQRNTDFVDIRPVMLKANGQPEGDLFRSDSLHMTEKGYQRWAKVLKPYLK